MPIVHKPIRLASALALSAFLIMGTASSEMAQADSQNHVAHKRETHKTLDAKHPAHKHVANKHVANKHAGTKHPLGKHPAVISPMIKMRREALALEDALLTLNTNRIDLLYAYLQSVSLTQGEVNQIKVNARQMEQIVGNATGAASLTETQKLELIRLFASSIDQAHLRVAFVSLDGKPINIADYKLSVKNHMKVLLEDSRGRQLAAMRPHPGDLSSGVIVGYVRAVDIAVQAAYELERYHHFVPMPRF